MIMIDIGDLKWAAGFLEGEGSFCFVGSSPCVQAGQVQKWPLEKLNLLFPRGKISFIKKKRKGCQDSWIWNLKVLDSVGLMMTLYTFMSPKRKEEIKKSLGRWKKGGRSRYSPICKRGHRLTPENTYTYFRGRRICKICKKMYERDRRKNICRNILNKNQLNLWVIGNDR